MKKSFATAAIIGSLFAANVLAAPPVTQQTDGVRHNTNVYAGMNIALGNKLVPSLVLGVFETRVKQNGNTEGGNLTVQINLQGGASLSKVKLGYLNGKNDLQGEVGGGYDLIKQAPFASVGVNAPFTTIRVDGFSLQELAPSLIIHTQDEFKTPKAANVLIVS